MRKPNALENEIINLQTVRYYKPEHLSVQTLHFQTLPVDCMLLCYLISPKLLSINI